jgi:hypothetical protein
MQGKTAEPVTRVICGVATAVAAVLLVGASPAAATATVPKAVGEGKDAFRLAFEFKAKDPAAPHGRAFFETNSFGDQAGDVDCLATKGRRAALSGELDAPASGLTHFMIIAQDRHKRRDRVVTWLRNGPFDCAAEISDDLADSLKKIKRGSIRVVG